jgi:hypothetical protein
MDIVVYSGSFPDSEDEYHVADGMAGVVRLINFGVDSAIVLVQHKHVVDKIVTPFLIQATEFLGPGTYDLRCIGLCSATGSFAHNHGLSYSRATAALEYTINSYNSQKLAIPAIARCLINPKPIPDGKIEASIDQVKRHIAYYDLERKQAHYRAVQFYLSAGREEPTDSTIFQIRSINLFKFESKSEPLPAVLKDIETVAKKLPTIEWILKRAGKILPLVAKLMDFVELVGKALGWEGQLAMIMIQWSIPKDIDACYEMKNWLSVHALYRFNGSGHQFDFGILDFLGLIGEVVATVKGTIAVLKKIHNLPKQLESVVDQAEKFIPEFHQKAVEFANDIDSEFGQLVDSLLTAAENNVSVDAALLPSSKFFPYQHHDRKASHVVTEYDGKRARRNVFGVPTRQVDDVEFGGAVPNNWQDFQAEAKIVMLTPNFVNFETSDGSLVLLKGNYMTDLEVGPLKVVTG